MAEMRDHVVYKIYFIQPSILAHEDMKLIDRYKSFSPNSKMPVFGSSLWLDIFIM